jgi:hypothetical protein
MIHNIQLLPLVCVVTTCLMFAMYSTLVAAAAAAAATTVHVTLATT